jgi:hypothetical protein
MQISTSEITPANSKKGECNAPPLDLRVTSCYIANKNQNNDLEGCLDFHTSNTSQTSNVTLLVDCVDNSCTQSPSSVPVPKTVPAVTHIDHLLQPNPSSPKHRLDNRHFVSNMELPIEPASLAHAQSTVLAQRSTVDVISDLKRKLHHPNGPFRRLDGGAAANPESLSTSLLPNQETPRVIVLAADNLTGLDDEDEDFEDGDDAPEGEEATTRPKRISERKRRLNAIADSWVQTSLLNPTEENRQVTADEEGSQSTKWLVNQSEDRVIATPREYQIELYERAKGKNIIAVLDTGLSVNSVVTIESNLSRIRQDMHRCVITEAYSSTGA